MPKIYFRILLVVFYSVDYSVNAQKLLPSKEWAFISEGRVFKGDIDVQVDRDFSDKEIPARYSYGSIDTVNSFYIYKAEISNAEYFEFINYLRKKNDTQTLSYVLPDTALGFRELGRKHLGSNYYLVNNLIQHSAFYQPNIPIHLVSYEGAIAYCNWLTVKLNEFLAGKAVVEARLPTENEWMRAARGNRLYLEYSWRHPSLQKNGYYFGNFATIDQTESDYDAFEGTIDKISFSSDDGHPYYATVKMYPPNENGVYDLSGNMAEMILEKGKTKGGSWKSSAKYLKVISVETYKQPSLAIGFRPVVVIKKIL